MATPLQLQEAAAAISVRISAANRSFRESESDADRERFDAERKQLRNEQAEINRQIEQSAPSIPSQSEYLGPDNQTGGFFYRNSITGNRFISGAPPTAAQQAAFGPQPEPPPPQSVAATVNDDAPSGPTAAPAQTITATGQVETLTTTSPTNAQLPATQENARGTTTGIDPPVKTTETTQAIGTDSNSGRILPAPGTTGNISATQGSVTLTPGTVTNDNSVDNSASAKQKAVNAATNTVIQIKPQANVLDEYASYSYSASVYLLTEDQYSKLLRSKIKKVDGYQLLFQSGGAPNNVGGVRSPVPATGSTDTGSAVTNPSASAVDGGRNPFFDNDFYIDSITINNELPGRATRAAHSVSTLKFTVVEPQGITLLDRLYQAVANSRPTDATGKVNYTAATYLMVMRFYGYDQDGKQVTIRGGKTDSEGTSDPRAVVEKFIPFRITAINWTIGSGLVSYTWECAAFGQSIAGYSARGTVPYDVQLVNSTVGGLLGKNVTYSTTPAAEQQPGLDASGRANAATDPRVIGAAPPNVNAAATPKKSINSGLMGAMNAFQQQLVQQGVYTYADEYQIEFLGEGAEKIETAKLVPANTKVDKRFSASALPATETPQNILPDKTSVDMLSRSFSITAGQQLLQAIELTVRNSSYISDQALIIFNPDGSYKPNPNASNTPLKWFTVTMSAEVISPKLDPKRNDFAYRIKYTVAPFVIKNINSKYFPGPTFSGVHKSYPYWFTGKNTAILEYKETLNTLFQATISGSDTDKNNAAKERDKKTASMSDILTYTYSPRSNESSSGASGKVNELAANAAELIYSAADLAACKVKIVGDPSWIMQGSAFKEVTDDTFRGLAVSTGFMPDGSIAFDNQEILFEIVWQRPEDYDLATGLADPYANTQSKYGNRKPIQSRVYVAKSIVSEFSRGSFEQHLEGVLYEFPVPDKSNTENPAAANNSDPSNSDAGAGRSSSQFAAIDPRRIDLAAGRSSSQFAAIDPRGIDLAAGRTAGVFASASASASVLGAQTFARLVPSAAGSAGQQSFGIPSFATAASTTGGTQLLPAGQPLPPTTETGSLLGTTVSGPGAPLKIGDIAGTAFNQGTQSGFTTTATDQFSSTNPANQQLARDF
jgi:hypothetical protein